MAEYVDSPGTPFSSSLHFEADGKQIGVLELRCSDRARRAPSCPIPAAVIRNGDGPTLLLTGGIHGDEYVGPAALFNLIRAVEPARLKGRLIVLPAVNTPAVLASTRCSPADDGNLNRSFIRDPTPGTTAAIARFIEGFVLPMCDAAVDIHSGGIGHIYANVSMVYLGAKSSDRASVALAVAFGADFLWSDHFAMQNTLNAAARRVDIPMMAVELGGGGGVDPRAVKTALGGLRRVMASLNMYAAEPDRPAAPITRQIAVPDCGAILAPREGLFVPSVAAGQQIHAMQDVGTLHSIKEPARPPISVPSQGEGIVVAVINRGYVRLCDRLVSIGQVIQ